MECSIVVTAYNVGEYIEECLNSLLGQTKKCEIIVVLDAPTDNTEEVVSKFKDKVKIVKNEKNVGAGMSRRIGIQHCTKEYVMLFDGDDYMEDMGHIEKLLQKAEETDADIVGGGIKILREDGSSETTLYGNQVFTGTDKVVKSWRNRTVYINNRIVRRSMYDIVPYSERRYVEDTPVIIPLLHYANKVITINESGYVYRMRGESLTHKNNILQDMIFKGLCWCDLNEFFEKNDKEVFKHLEIKQFISNILKLLNKMKIEEAQLEPYRNEWSEFMRKLINNIQITGINFKA